MNWWSRRVSASAFIIFASVVVLAAIALVPVFQMWLAYGLMGMDGLEALTKSQNVAFYQFVLSAFTVLAVIAGYLTYRSRQDAIDRGKEEGKAEGVAMAKAYSDEFRKYAEELKEAMEIEVAAVLDGVSKAGRDVEQKIQEVGKEKVSEIQGIQLPVMNESDQEKRIRETLNRGVQLYSMGHAEEAIDRWRSVLQVNPSCSVAYANISAAMYKLGRLSEAIAQLKGALDLMPDSTELRWRLARLLAEEDRWDEAEEMLRWVVKSEPSNAAAWNDLGIVLVGMGENEHALRAYQRAIGLDPKLINAYVNLSNAYSKGGREQEALEACHAGVSANPESALLRLNMGLLYRKKGLLNDAMDSLREATRLNPGFANAHYNMACIQALKGKIDDAAKSLHKAVSLEHDYCKMAREDEDFDGVRNEPEIIDILGKPPYDNDGEDGKEGLAAVPVPK